MNWSDVLGQHPAKHAASAVRSATGLPAGTTPNRGSANAPTTRASDARAGQPQRGSQSTGPLYSPSSPRMHVPLATAHAAHSAATTSPSAHKASRSAAAHRTDGRSSARRDAHSPEETARDDLRRKLTNPTSDSGATSQRSTSTAAASQQSKPRRRAREPRATPQHGAPAHVDAIERGSSTRRDKSSPRKARVYCGQNRLDPSLRVNGGTLEVGTRSRCFRSGFGAALHQDVVNAAEFIREFTAPYEPLVSQKLWYKDKPPPEGYQPATLSQARQRGFGAGSAALARKLQKERHGGSTDARSDLVRRPVARA